MKMFYSKIQDYHLHTLDATLNLFIC